VGRDIDDGGRLLWITKGKTESSTRKIAIPDLLVPHMARLALAAGPAGGLFVGASALKDKKKHRVDWLRRHVERVCKLAGVPVVGCHGLRGTFSSLAVGGDFGPRRCCRDAGPHQLRDDEGALRDQ
jgi:integrase